MYNNEDNYGQQPYMGTGYESYTQQPYMGTGYEPYGQQPQGTHIINFGMLAGLLSSVLLFLGMVLPIIDFSAFDENVDIQYNLIKVCKNLGLISAPWTGIPYGLAIAALSMLVLSFVRIPPLRIIPCIIAVGMIIIMLTDIGNIIEWVKSVLEQYFSESGTGLSDVGVMDGVMCGAYFLAAGIIMGIISCFLGNKKTAA